MSAVDAFIRERGRYAHAQRRYYEARKIRWDAIDTERDLDRIQNQLEWDDDLREEYRGVYDFGRDYGADVKWVASQIAKINEHEKLGLRADRAAHERGPNGERSDFDQAGLEAWENGTAPGVHPLARLPKRAQGKRGWDEFERTVLGFIHDAGGANVRPGEQMPKEIVQVAHDKAVAHLGYLEPLVAGLSYSALTYADLLIVSYPARLLANAKGTKTGKMGRGTKRLVDSLQFCEGCGLPFMRFTKVGNPTTKPKTCDRACWNLKRSNYRAKARGAAT